MTNRRKYTTRELAHRHAERPSDPLLAATTVWLHDVRSLHNVGSVFRSADAFGIASVWLSGYTPVPPRPEITKTALGAEATVPWLAFPSADAVLARIRAEGRTLWAVEQTTDSILLDHLPHPLPADPVLLFGNEVTGVDDRLLAAAHAVLEIPQFGRKHSLNLSVSAGIVLFGLHAAVVSQAGRP